MAIFQFHNRVFITLLIDYWDLSGVVWVLFCSFVILAEERKRMGREGRVE